MKRKKLVLLMILAAILLGALTVMTNLFPGWLSSLLAFPLEPVSLGLTAMAHPAGSAMASRSCSPPRS